MTFIAVYETQFKVTEIGPIPHDWELSTLGHIAEKPQYGFTASATTKRTGIKLLRITDVQHGRVNWDTVPYVTCSLNEVETYQLSEGNILFARTGGTTGKSYIAKHLPKEPVIFASYLIRIKARSFMDDDFTFHYLQSQMYWHQVQQLKTGAAQPGINGSKLQELVFPLPPLAEQQRIAAVLNTLQEEIAAQEEVIAAAKDFKRSLMQRLFTYGPDSEPAPTKLTEIGEIPAHWEVVEFGRHLDIVSGQVDPRIAPYRDMIHIGPEHIESGTGRILEHKTSHELGIRSGNYLFSSGHILYSKIRPYLNKVAMATFDGVCSADIYPIRADDKYLVQGFVIQFLLSDYFLEQATAHQQRTGIPKINREQLRTTLIPLPLSLAEQQEVANLLEAVDEKIVTGTERRAALRETYLSLLHQLMTGKIRLLEA